MTKAKKQSIRNPYAIPAAARKAGAMKKDSRLNGTNQQRQLLEENDTNMSQVVCDFCNDTHIMPHSGWMCTRCPAPCQKCRMNGTGAFCETTPCSCVCHKEYKEFMEWYEGPLTKERLAELRYKLAKARGLLISFINWEGDDRRDLPTTQEIKDILKETEDPA